MCRYVAQPNLLTALLKYLTDLSEYLDFSILICLKIIQIPFRIIEGMYKWGLDNQGFIVLKWLKMHIIIMQVFNIKQHIVLATILFNIKFYLRWYHCLTFLTRPSFVKKIQR